MSGATRYARFILTPPGAPRSAMFAVDAERVRCSTAFRRHIARPERACPSL